MKFATTFTRCRDGKPLMELDGTPFNGLEIRPTDLRRLGETLMWLADLGTALPTDGRHWKATKVEVDMDSTQRHPAPNDAAEVAYRAVQFIKGFAETFNAANAPVIPTARIEVAREKRLAGQLARLAQRQALDSGSSESPAQVSSLAPVAAEKPAPHPGQSSP